MSAIGLYIGWKISIKMAMRISGGAARGIVLDVPPGLGALRPATDFLRAAVFSSLGQLMDGAFVLDLFAGIGSYGLEALSRGAEGCVFVEKNMGAVEALATNVERVKKSTGRDFAVETLCRDVFQWLETCNDTFDVIFIDPPYDVSESRGAEILTMVSRLLRPSANSRAVFEVSARCPIDGPDGLVQIRRLGRGGRARHPNALIYGQGQ
jgi:16S rRNA (guanine966-N2)-methyltransferase